MPHIVTEGLKSMLEGESDLKVEGEVSNTPGIFSLFELL
jgi:hypothetical protein